MYRVILFIISLLFISLTHAESRGNKTVSHYDDIDQLRDSFIHNKANLQYYNGVGVNGKIWSIIVKDECGYKIMQGNNMNKTYDIISTDTISSILEWGFNSLCSESKKMTPEYRKKYWFGYRNLIFVSSNGSKEFELNNAISFKGKNSKKFNDKFWKLWYLMYWLSDPDDEWRDILPPPEW